MEVNKIGLGGNILIQYRLNAQINLGISRQEVYKPLGGKIASEAIVGQFLAK